MQKNEYVKGVDIYYPGVLRSIRKSDNSRQPIFEAFTNALESFPSVSPEDEAKNITVQLYHTKALMPDVFDFNKIVFEDTGIGFDDDNYDRFKRLNDNTKTPNSRGSGRLQLLHFFDTSEYISIYRSGPGTKRRHFILSKADSYLKENAIIQHLDTTDIEPQKTKTILTLKKLLLPKDQVFYDRLNLESLREALLSHYVLYFCVHREKMPSITLEQYINDKLDKTIRIKPEDVPEIDKQENIAIPYAKLSADGKTIEHLADKKEIFHFKAFKINSLTLSENEVRLTSKEEVIDDTRIQLDCLSPKEKINDMRYLFIISGKYLDEKDSDTRGDLNIPTGEDLKKSRKDSQSLFSDEDILLDDLTEQANSKILSMYDEIRNKRDEHILELEKLKKMFLLNKQTIDSSRINLNDTEEKILEKVYTADAKSVARIDAKIKMQMDRLDVLEPGSKNYDKSFADIVAELVTEIPLQNRTALTHYIARRKLILDIFDKILARQLKIQDSNPRNIDERLLHNLIFQQSSSNPENSDLWLINEDFIYFKGTSDARLSDIKIDGKAIIKESLTPEEELYRTSLGEDRLLKRPDILLFPGENKCIIIEFKNPDVNISEYLNQINRYASLILNLSKPEYRFHTFYGYLIGEKIAADDVRDHDSDFVHSYHLDYVFRPSKAIVGKFGRNDGSLYTEVLKYSTLLERAKRRNEIFIKKLTQSYPDQF